ncbi:HD domain-containing phosphohydrolase [Neptuniibacter sp. CAU 1671]|uniref:HD-GYP domain-containing protein n=1 Tax=Neptuniibacter sp. CAU 1671 TaxID=3032593 RepID=UPI0023DBE43F|nr:HD domain-containing phosphohydrolase [Neptuniibacter sp. CAU 1671]MDF2181836.1 HD domain-containing protein [Neptuniibacter sp. CAU 1671]
MSEAIKNHDEKILTADDLEVGFVLPWDLYSANGSMLLSKNREIKSQQQIEQLISYGARFYEQSTLEITASDNEHAELSKKHPAEPPVSFLIIQQLAKQLEIAFSLLTDEKDRTFANKILRIALDIQTACMENANAMIGSIQLTSEATHSVLHPLHNAILCEVSYSRIGKGPLERLQVVAAALTSDIGMLAIKEQVHQQAEPLTPEQKEIINNHPNKSREMLEKKGVTETCWLDAVQQHHERVDGSGYPSAISGENLITEAKLIAIIDNYTALVRPRPYRDRITHKDALRQMLQQRGNSIDSELVRLFINSIGIYSPGSMVKMQSGEIGIVTTLTSKIDQPDVLLITDTDEKPLNQPSHVKLTNEGYVISAMLCSQKYKALLENLGTIWPMRHPLALQSEYVY